MAEESVPGNNGSASAGGPRSWRQSRDFTPEEYRGRLVDPETAARATVGNAEKHGEGFKDAYVTYEVVSHVRVPHRPRSNRQFPTAGASCKMRRRYQDFMWLLGKLAAKSNGGVILPPLPDKNRLGMRRAVAPPHRAGFMDRFSPDYIRKRQQGLERFLNRLLSHPRLAGDPELKSFLTVPIIGVDSVQPVPSLESPTGMAAVVEHLSDAVISVFSRPRPVEERFLVMRRVVGIAEGHFERIAALHGKLVASYRGTSICTHTNRPPQAFPSRSCPRATLTRTSLLFSASLSGPSTLLLSKTTAATMEIGVRRRTGCLPAAGRCGRCLPTTDSSWKSSP